MRKYSDDLKWLRGANRWNNGATRFQNKYALRVLIGQQKQYEEGKINKIENEQALTTLVDRLHTVLP